MNRPVRLLFLYCIYCNAQRTSKYKKTVEKKCLNKKLYCCEHKVYSVDVLLMVFYFDNIYLAV